METHVSMQRHFELVFAIATAPFGEDEGCIVIIVKALYGLKTSGAAWHAFLADTVNSMGYAPCRLALMYG